MAIDVRTVSEDEFPAWIAAMSTGFFSHAREGEAEVRRIGVDLSRVWGAFDGETIVGTLRSWPSDLTLPGGGIVTAAALTNVTVRSTHRRQGLLTRMLEPDLRLAVDRGEPAGILIGAEYPIYGRYGYGPATRFCSMSIDARAARFLHDRPAGSVELIDHAALRKVGPELYERVRRQVPGSISRTEHWWDRVCRIVEIPGEDPFKGFLALGRDQHGEPDGYLEYKVESKFDSHRPAALLTIEELVSTTPAAYERLWRYACEVDWVNTVTAADRSVDELLPWLVVDARGVTTTAPADFQWVRPLDVPALLSSRTYLAPGRVVLEVVDPLGYAAGRFVVDGGPEGATCAATTESAGLTLGVDVLGAVTLGDHSLRQLAAAGLLDVHDAAALAVADVMFRGEVTPWCSTWF